MPSTDSAIALICSGVVPQQPPTRFTNPSFANPDISLAICPGDWSYSPNSLGSPAFGYANTYKAADFESSLSQGRISLAPSAQFSPIANGFECKIE